MASLHTITDQAAIVLRFLLSTANTVDEGSRSEATDHEAICGVPFSAISAVVLTSKPRPRALLPMDEPSSLYSKSLCRFSLIASVFV